VTLWAVVKIGFKFEQSLLILFTCSILLDYTNPGVTLPQRPESPVTLMLRKRIQAMNWRILFNKVNAFALIKSTLQTRHSLKKCKSHELVQPSHHHAMTHGWKSWDCAHESVDHV
jgi:hypothetical protein